MQKKSITFEDLSDIVAFRVIVETVEDCYRALGILHSKYQVVPGRFKDYISTPKQNGYQSIHTSVMGPGKRRIEMQIRTFEMHETAELGVAAHWAYKQEHNQKDKKDYGWLKELLEIMEHAQQPEEFLEHTKLELYQDQVFCFSPKGDLISLPAGSTPVDFAYAVHSEIGNKCVGAKINGKLMPLRSVLENGDQVEVITSKTSMPSPAWERFVKTGRAKACIRKFIRTQQRGQYVNLGKSMLQKFFAQEGIDLSDKALESVKKHYKASDVDDIYMDVGAGSIPARELFKKLYPDHKSKEKEQDLSHEDQIAAFKDPLTRSKRKNAVPLRGLIPGMAYQFAKCCSPLPGDRVIGIITSGKGVTIHTIDCEKLGSFEAEPERWVDVDWDPESLEEGYVGRILLYVLNEKGTLSTLSTIIAKNDGNITNFKILTRSKDCYELMIDLLVKDAKMLSNIIAALRASRVVNSVERSRGQ